MEFGNLIFGGTRQVLSWLCRWRLWKWYESGKHPKLQLGDLSKTHEPLSSVHLVSVLWLWNQCLWHSFGSVDFLFRLGYQVGLMAILCQRHFWTCDNSFWLSFCCPEQNSLRWFGVCFYLGHLKLCQGKWFWFGPKLLHHLLSRRTVLLLVL